jgi:hypothetical protein
MICWAIKNGVPFDVAHSMELDELVAYAITFGKLENGNKPWDWDNMRWIDK